MAGGKVENVALTGIACAVPDSVSTLDDTAMVFGEEQTRRIAKNLGVLQRHVASKTICASDLCFFAAERLLDELAWERESIDLVVFASVTPDYITPATSCILQDRLGVGKGCAAFDITHPCSGYTYGLWVVANLLSSGNLKRALLLNGDTVSRMVSPQDRSIATLVGDAGSATSLEWNVDAAPTFFEMGSDGGGYRHLIKKAGGFRHPATGETSRRTERENRNIRSDEDLFMDGAEIFAFAVREVPPLTEKVLDRAGWVLDDVDAVVMHQANQFMIRHLAKKLKIPKEKHIENLANFGNTSGVSIPMAITNKLQDSLSKERHRLVLLGFGAGLSWGGVAVTCGPLVVSDLVKVSAADVPGT